MKNRIKYISPDDIGKFENVFRELEEDRYNSIQLEMKRHMTVSKKIKVDKPDSYFQYIADFLKLDIDEKYFKIENKISKVINFEFPNVIEFLQIYREFYVETKIVFKKKKILFRNHFKHIIPLISDSSTGIMLKKHLKSDFKKRYKNFVKLISKKDEKKG